MSEATVNNDSAAALVAQAQVNPLRTRQDWQRMRDAATADPGAFHGAIAKQQIHWFVASVGTAGAWLSFDAARKTWSGWDARTGAALDADLGEAFEPWQLAFNADDPPHWRWFEGGLTNACFNEVDRHVLSGFGDEAAFLSRATAGTCRATTGAARRWMRWSSRASGCCLSQPNARWRCRRWA